MQWTNGLWFISSFALDSSSHVVCSIDHWRFIIIKALSSCRVHQVLCFCAFITYLCMIVNETRSGINSIDFIFFFLCCVKNRKTLFYLDIDQWSIPQYHSIHREKKKINWFKIELTYTFHCLMCMEIKKGLFRSLH